MIKFLIKPYDVLYFGGGRPFNVGDTAKAIFPPFPHTFASAICAKIYSWLKISVHQILREVYGPFLFNEENKEVYFPKPSDIYTEKKSQALEIYSLSLLSEKKRLFKPENTNKPVPIETFAVYRGGKDVEPFEGFVSKTGLQDWINGKVPKREHIVPLHEVFEYENRIGIKQDRSLRTVVSEDGLYRIDFLRLKDNWRFVFWVEFNLENQLQRNNFLNDEDKILEFFNKEPKSLKLGGEMKNASYEVSRDDIKQLLTRPKIEQGKIFKILFLTPVTFNITNNSPDDCSHSIVPKNSNGMEIKSLVTNGFMRLAINSRGLKTGFTVKRALKPGTIMYATINNNIQDPQKELWFSPLPFQRDNKFIGTNLVIYTKEIENDVS